MSGKPGGTKRHFAGIKGKRPDNKAHRVEEAKTRLEAWQDLSLKDQLEVLNNRLSLKKISGECKKQIAKIMHLINNPKPVKVVEVVAEKAKTVETAKPVVVASAVEKVKRYMANKKSAEEKK